MSTYEPDIMVDTLIITEISKINFSSQQSLDSH